MNSTLKIFLALKLKILILLLGMGVSLSVGYPDRNTLPGAQEAYYSPVVFPNPEDTASPENRDTEHVQISETHNKPGLEVTGLEELGLFIEL